MAKRNKDQVDSKTINLILGLVAVISSGLLFFNPALFRIVVAIILLLWGMQNLTLLFLDWMAKRNPKKKK